MWTALTCVHVCTHTQAHTHTHTSCWCIVMLYNWSIYLVSKMWWSLSSLHWKTIGYICDHGASSHTLTVRILTNIKHTPVSISFTHLGVQFGVSAGTERRLHAISSLSSHPRLPSFLVWVSLGWSFPSLTLPLCTHKFACIQKMATLNLLLNLIKT